MELAFNIALAAGIIVEILLLWETSNRQRNIPLKPGFIASGVSRAQEAIALVVLVAWTLILPLEFFNPQFGSGFINWVSETIMLLAGLFLFIAGLWYHKFLPRINEQTLVVVTAIVLLSLYGQVQLDWYWLAALSVPLIGIFILALTKHILHPALKSLFYFWYLMCLLVMAYLGTFDLLFNLDTGYLETSFNHFIAGAAGLFFLLHCVFLVRFFLMLTANILPWNRYLIALAMPQLFGDEQMSRRRFVVILLVVLGILWANLQFGLVTDINLASLLILFVVHFMDRGMPILPKFR
ncbi:MAG: hypothetical protein R6W69_02200 [Anaerolineales bacterium]